MDRLKRVLIIGGGPAGMSAAWALKRTGMADEVEILEIRDDGRPAGIGLLLTSPALRVLQALDLLDGCRDVGEPLGFWNMFTADGTPTAKLPLQNVMGPDFPPALGISRIRLHEMLAARIESLGIPVRCGTTVERLQQDAQGVDAVLSDGSTQRYDMVIGADGLHSKTRAMLLKHSPQPQATGQMVWRTSYVRQPEHDGYQVFLQGPTRMGLVPISPTSGYVWMLDAMAPTQRPEPEALYALWKERTATYCPTVRSAADQITSPDQLDFRMLQNLIVPPPWHHGRVVLIGDAIHATTPHLAFGVGLAFEDSFVLTEELRAAQSLEEAFTRFAQRRYPRSTMVIQDAQALGDCDLHPERMTRTPQEIIRSNMLAMCEAV